MSGRKRPGLTLAQLDSLGRMDQAGFDAAADITRQLLGAQDRRAARPQRSEDETRGGLPPPTNRGGKSSGGSAETVSLVLEDGKVKEVIKRRGYGGSAAFIDWINFTVGIETFDNDNCMIGPDTLLHEEDKRKPMTPYEYIIAISRRMMDIFGFGVSHALGYGANFYQETFAFPETYGQVSYGGQNRTVLITLTGTGLAAAKEGWEFRLFEFLGEASRSRITCIDLAHDDYEGLTYSVDQADQDHTDGLMNCGGRNPRCEHRGDWKNPDGKGRSIYFGNRKNGKYCRVYEKGRELGCPTSDWVRIEVEYKSCDRVIPFDVLFKPGEYLAASYPAFIWIETHQERIETTRRVVEANVDKAWKFLRHQVGNYVAALVDLAGPDEFFNRVCRTDKVPAFAKVPHFALVGPALHERRFSKPPVNLSAAASAW